MAYTEAGTVDAASTLVVNADGSMSGSLVVDVSRANHRAKGDIGQTVSYTFATAAPKIRFDGGTTAVAAGERVRLIGKLAVVGKKCDPISPASTPAFRTIVVHPA